MLLFLRQNALKLAASYSWLRIRYLACPAFQKWITCPGVMRKRSDTTCRFADGELSLNRADCRVGEDMTDWRTLLWLDKWTHLEVVWSGRFLKRADLPFYQKLFSHSKIGGECPWWHEMQLAPIACLSTAIAMHRRVGISQILLVAALRLVVF